MKKDGSDDRWGMSVVDTTEYFRAFTTYLDFWDRALDEYKTELNLLKFPIFKHLYLDMLQLNESGSAFEFLHKYKVVFDSNSDRKKEIHRLSTGAAFDTDVRVCAAFQHLKESLHFREWWF